MITAHARSAALPTRYPPRRSVAAIFERAAWQQIRRLLSPATHTKFGVQSAERKSALERTPSGLPRSEYWRLVTPLLVQTLGWYQVLANLTTLAVIGAVTEWVLGCRWWLTLVIAGTTGGQLAAYHWHEWGGGDSIAICGLAAGVLVAQLVGRHPPVRWAADAVLYYIVALAGWGLVGIVGAGLAVVAAVAGLWLVRRIDPAGGYRLALAATGLGALGLAALRDLHGAALTAAMLLSAIVLICRNWVGSSG